MVLSIAASVLGKVLGSAVVGLFTTFWGKIKPCGDEDLELLEESLIFILCGLQTLSGSEPTNQFHKVWMAKARELVYDIGDVTSKFNGANASDQHIFKKILEEIKSFGGFCKNSDLIKEAKKSVIFSEKLYEYASGGCNDQDDRRRCPLNTPGKRDLVGMEDPTNKIKKLLAIGDAMDVNKGLMGTSIGHKVVAITGVGGLGKTTLAAIVCNEIGCKFECKARVFVGRNSDPKVVLQTLLQEFEKDCQGPAPTLVSRIQDHVENKRFLVLLDDVWDDKLLPDVKNALLGGKSGGRIIITTRRNDVAVNWTALSDKGMRGGDFCIKPLDDNHSEELLLRKGPLIGNKCQTSKEYLKKIFAKCNGSPLALTAVQNVVRTRCKGQIIPWDEVYKLISAIDEPVPQDILDMRNDLSHSYWDLPYEYRDCFLYLSLFPNDQINKKHLVSRWVAEELIAEDQGRNIFKDLVNRNLILKSGIKYDGDESIYQVHPTIHDFVVWKSVEYNFITLPGDTDRAAKKIRRISVHRNTEGRENIKLAGKNLSALRSLTMCDGLLPTKEISSVLRVLDLEDCTNGSTVTPPITETTGAINRRDLFRRNLRYLKLKKGLKGYDCNVYLEYYLQMTGLMDGLLSPENLISSLNPESTTGVKGIESACNLKTLDLRGFGNTSLDKAVTGLKFLARLLVDPETRLPHGIGNMKALEELLFIDIWFYDVEFIKELCKLQKLKAIGICLSEGWSTKKEMELLSALLHLAKNHINSLSVCIDGVGIHMCGPHTWGLAIQAFRKFRMMRGCHFDKVLEIRKDATISPKLQRLRLGSTPKGVEQVIKDLSASCASFLSHLFLDLEVPRQKNENNDIFSNNPIIENYNFANKGLQHLTHFGIRFSRSNIKLNFSIGTPQHLKLQLAADEVEIPKGLPDGFYFDKNLITSRNEAPNEQATKWTAVHIITRPPGENEEMVVTIKIKNNIATLSIEVQDSRKRDASSLHVSSSRPEKRYATDDASFKHRILQ